MKKKLMSKKVAPTPDEAVSVLVAARQKRVEDCNRELEAVLAKYNCGLDVAVTLKANAIVPQVSIVAKD